MIKKLFVILSLISASALAAQEPLGEYSIGISSNVSTGDFAPYFIGSLNHGKSTQKGGSLLDVGAVRRLDLGTRFSYGYGAEALTGYTTNNDYWLYDGATQEWGTRSEGPAGIWLQQLYAEVKYRGVFLTVGMKERESALFNTRLGSGDLVESGNARPIPEVRAGFIDFQDIPFTNGWVQIQGEISYGKMMDNNYMKHHFNYYNYHITLGSLYSYKRCYFRTKPSQPLSLTVGMQVGAFFGGEEYKYRQGKLYDTRKFSKSLRTFFNMFLPMGENGEDYYSGSSLGSWDAKLRYRLKNDDELYAYVSWPWEDGSGIGRMNKFDGVWGLEYKAARRGYLTGLVVEYIDFRDQSGPIHWSPDDSPGTTIVTSATGRDDYYNNTYYNSYANYGMAIGSPFLKSPIYNLDGYPAFACTRANGFHIGAEGMLLSDLDYRVLIGYQRGLGTYLYPYYQRRRCGSAMLELKYDAHALLPGISGSMQVAVDRGSLRGNNFGVAFTIVYKGKL